LYFDDKNLSGFGTDVIDEVAPEISYLINLSALFL
jgi:hypothetical protein